MPRLDPADPRVQLLVAGVGVRDRSDWARVPCEALGEEEILCCPGALAREGRLSEPGSITGNNFRKRSGQDFRN
jgi:hypothetical protein